jgi:hypothetical protein
MLAQDQGGGFQLLTFSGACVLKNPNHDNRRRAIFGSRHESGSLSRLSWQNIRKIKHARYRSAKQYRSSLAARQQQDPHPAATWPAKVSAPPPYARATTSCFPLRSHTMVSPVLLEPARTYWICWFHATDVISSNLVLCELGVGVYGLFRSFQVSDIHPAAGQVGE